MTIIIPPCSLSHAFCKPVCYNQCHKNMFPIQIRLSMMYHTAALIPMLYRPCQLIGQFKTALACLMQSKHFSLWLSMQLIEEERVVRSILTCMQLQTSGFCVIPNLPWPLWLPCNEPRQCAAHLHFIQLLLSFFLELEETPGGHKEPRPAYKPPLSPV